MKTNLLRFWLTAQMLLVTTACYAYDAYIDGIYYNLIPKAKAAEVTYGDSQYKGTVAIPQTITHDGIEYQVVTIGDNAFKGCYSLTSVKIPNTVTSINNYAFAACTSLSSITIGNSVTSIGYYAFNCCQSLSSIIIPSSVTSIGRYAFSDCTSLTSITIPNTVKYIEFDAFQRCTSLKSITLPNSLTTIESYIFADCTSLTSINIPESVKSIQSHAFYNCTSLKSITIPQNVKSIYAYAFGGCINLENVYCYCQEPPYIVGAVFEVFEGSYIEYATLYVPDETLTEYTKTVPWKDFRNILPLSQISQGIEIVYGGPTTVVSYDIAGRRINEMQNGVNIIRTEDGKTVKVLKK